jgi:hypothetical protein
MVWNPYTQIKGFDGHIQKSSSPEFHTPFIRTFQSSSNLFSFLSVGAML